MNDCQITLLPSDCCGHCSQVTPVAVEPSYERCDYVETSHDRPRQVDVQPEQFTDHVDYKDIYGEQQALRLARRK